MKLAIVSGKGGTGKTSLAVSLALCAAGSESVCLLDCDAEEPDAHLLLHPVFDQEWPVNVLVPAINPKRCTGCGLCAQRCAFHALANVPPRPLLFPELCHGCGLCAALCPASAITEIPRQAGTLRGGKANGIEFVQGRMAVGEGMSSPLIRAVLKKAKPSVLTIVDGPPGTSCPMVAAVEDCDMAIIVTDPTPFGVHDLQLAVEALRKIRVPFAVVVNRVSGTADAGLHAWCVAEEIFILGEIPEDRRIAEAYSRGIPLWDSRPDLQPLLRQILAQAKTFGRPDKPGETP